MAVGQNQWYQFGVGAPPILEPIFVVGLNRMFTGGYDLGFDPWPFRQQEHIFRISAWTPLAGDHPREARSPRRRSCSARGATRCARAPACGREGEIALSLPLLLGPARCPSFSFLGEGSPKVDDRKKWVPYPSLSTGGPSLLVPFPFSFRLCFQCPFCLPLRARGGAEGLILHIMVGEHVDHLIRLRRVLRVVVTCLEFANKIPNSHPVGC